MAMERIISGMEAELATMAPNDPARRFILKEKDKFMLEMGKEQVHAIRSAVAHAFPLHTDPSPDAAAQREAFVLHANILLVNERMRLTYSAIAEEFGLEPAQAFSVLTRSRRLYGVNPDFARTVDSIEAYLDSDPKDEKPPIAIYP